MTNDDCRLGKRSKLGAWLQLLRAPNLLTVPGVDPDRIVRIPYAYNPSRFAPCHRPTFWKNPSESRFTFLCLAMPHLRKGVRELVRAFREEFDPDEPVQLILKMPYIISKSQQALYLAQMILTLNV